MISSFQSKQEQQQVQISTMLHSHTEEVGKSMVEVRQYHTTILESRNEIMDMKTEVHDILEEIRGRTNRDTRSHETVRTHDRSTARRHDFEPREWRNQTVMMRTQDHKHVIPESQEYNAQFATKFPNLSE